jgi:Ser/Thr protein kinase RdoA (MazF antagonist)
MIPKEVLDAYGVVPGSIERAPTGLIHQTYFVDRSWVVQRVHPAFGEAVLADLDSVTERLVARGMTTPRPRLTLDGALGTRDAQGHLWRMLTYLDGHTVEALSSPAMAADAARLVALFHLALLEDPVALHHHRPGVHDTRGHLQRLERAGAGALGEAILAEASHIQWPGELPARLAHGDLKISNVLFRGERAVALLDLDTIGWMPLRHELGDGWRSWCNPLGESTEDTRFELPILAAAAGGYFHEARAFATRDEAESLVGGIHAVAVELAARFATDMMEDRYFGWDPARFPSRREHNRVRAAGQLALARQVRAAWGAAETAVMSAFSGRPSAPA